MLPIKRQVIRELVNQHAGDETHVGAAAFNDADRCVRADNGLRRLEFDDRPPVLENDVAAGALGEPIAVLVTDDFEFFRREPLRFGCSEFDDFDRYAGFIEEGNTVIAGVGFLCRRPPRMRCDGTFSGRRRGGLFKVKGFTQAHLTRGAVDDSPFAFLAKVGALEPVELVLEAIDFPTQRVRQIDDLLRAERGRCIKAGHTV